MTAVVITPPARRAGGVMRVMAGRLLRLELKRNAMMLLVPLVVAMFWFDTYRSSMQMPAIWPARLLFVEQGRALVDFAPFVAGAAAWTGSRDGRRSTDEQVVTTSLPRWAARLPPSFAVAVWALAAYVLCMTLLLGVSASQGADGPLPWWPVVVGAFGVLLFSALGFAAGAVFPSRFTVPLVAVAVLLLLVLTQYPITHNTTYGLLSPTNLMGAPGPQAGIFQPFPPGLSITQIVFMAGLTVIGIGLLGFRGTGVGARGLAAVVTIAGLAAAGYGVRLAGTAKMTANGPTVPAFRTARDGKAVAYTPVCDGFVVKVCVNPVYKDYLPRLTTALRPLLTEVADLPGAPKRVDQAVFPFHGDAVYTTSSLNARTGVLDLGLSIGMNGATCLVTGPKSSTCTSVTDLWKNSNLVDTVVRAHTAQTVFGQMIGDTTDAQKAVQYGLLRAIGVTLTDPSARSHLPPGAPQVFNPEVQVLGPRRGSPVDQAARKFAALSQADRHRWLQAHLAALRAGQLTLADLP